MKKRIIRSESKRISILEIWWMVGLEVVLSILLVL